MDWIILGIIAFVVYHFYRAGKREGSREGYNVGRFRRRRRQ
jgi:hypothetical protein